MLFPCLIPVGSKISFILPLKIYFHFLPASFLLLICASVHLPILFPRLGMPLNDFFFYLSKSIPRLFLWHFPWLLWPTPAYFSDLSLCSTKLNKSLLYIFFPLLPMLYFQVLIVSASYIFIGWMNLIRWLQVREHSWVTNESWCFFILSGSKEIIIRVFLLTGCATLSNLPSFYKSQFGYKMEIMAKLLLCPFGGRNRNKIEKYLRK